MGGSIIRIIFEIRGFRFLKFGRGGTAWGVVVASERIVPD